MPGMINGWRWKGIVERGQAELWHFGGAVSRGSRQDVHVSKSYEIAALVACSAWLASEHTLHTDEPGAIMSTDARGNAQLLELDVDIMCEQCFGTHIPSAGKMALALFPLFDRLPK